MSSCSYLPTADRKFFTKARLVHALDSALEDCDIGGQLPFDSNGYEDENCDYYDEDESVRIGRVRPDLVPIVNRVEVGTCPWFNAFKDHHSVRITVDCGAQVEMIRESVALAMNAKITKASQGALQADERTPLVIVGETAIRFTRGDL